MCCGQKRSLLWSQPEDQEGAVMLGIVKSGPPTACWMGLPEGGDNYLEVLRGSALILG